MQQLLFAHAGHDHHDMEAATHASTSGNTVLWITVIVVVILLLVVFAAVYRKPEKHTKTPPDKTS